ncbi:zinc finger protein 473 [Ochotona curzoniae]|uniref:zinc finger protein 473 n=1 Tax=Ochotona curzoniae TaxID=130825 RepID=UPI001B34B9D6|nr:zinc finger protein 473 [Ochotona curzoniae]
MDFTLENWEQLGLDPGDLFWDTLLDNYRDLFLLNSYFRIPNRVILSPTDPLRSAQLSCQCPDDVEKLEAQARSSPETMGPDDPVERLVQELKQGPTPCSLPPTTGASVEQEPPAGSLMPALSQGCHSELGQRQPDGVCGEEQPFKCSECGACFSDTYCLIQHWAAHAQAELPRPCEDPYGRVFLQTLGLAVQSAPSAPYMYDKHEGTFSQDTQLLWHQQPHAWDEPSLIWETNSPTGPDTQPMAHSCSQLLLITQHHGTHTQDFSSSREANSPTGPDSQPMVHSCSQPLVRHHVTQAQDETSPSQQADGLTGPDTQPTAHSCSQPLVVSQDRRTHVRKCYQCSECPEIFSLSKLFTRHQRMHVATKAKAVAAATCQQCGKTFRRSVLLVTHQAIHTGEKPYRCTECNKAFSHMATLQIHQQVHSFGKQFACKECGKTFSRSTHLCEHQRVHTGYRPYQCRHCMKTFNRPSHLQHHLSTHVGEAPYHCPRCPATFSHQELLAQHQVAHSAEARNMCQQCGERFVCSSTLSCHLQAHTSERAVPREPRCLAVKHFKCDKCDKDFGRSKYLTQHKRTHATVKPFVCAPCGKAFGHRAQLARHQSSHSGPKGSEPGSTMPHGASSLEQQPWLLTERPSQSTESSDATFSQGTAGHQSEHLCKRAWPCDHCDRVFTHRRYLARHQGTHAGQRPVECHECGKTFDRSASLAKHRRNVHSGEKAHVCAICSKAFAQRAQLLRHERVHTGEKPYMCPRCGKAFSQSSCLTIHQRVHTGEKPFTCEQCGKAFAQKAQLGQHARTHSGEKPHSCAECGRAFALHAHLSQHQRTHTQERPYQCPLCPRAFTCCSGLSRHQRTHKAGPRLDCPPSLQEQ